MRFITITPASSEQLRDAVLDDLELLAPGLRPIATALPVDHAGVIDLLATDERGRLVVVAFPLEADAGALARGIAQWDWAAANRGLLRALLPVIGLDPSQEPRLLFVAGTVSGDFRRLAAHVTHPDFEIHEATLISADGARGVLLRRATGMRRMPADTGIDQALAGLPAGEARSLMRRILTELRDAGGDEDLLTPVGIEGGLDLLRDGRSVASLVCAPDGVELRTFDPAGSLSITNDSQCREAVQVLMSFLDSVDPVATQTGPSPDAGVRPPAGAALTPEEIAEFGRLGSRTPASAPRDAVGAPPEISGSPEQSAAGAGEEAPERVAGEPPAVRILKTGFMEN